MSRPSSAAPDVVPFAPLADEYEMPLAITVNGHRVVACVEFRRAKPGDSPLPFAPGWTCRVSLPLGAAGQAG